jgi:glyoxylase-like metal-dependent hydrolase (beta-lactamase superfamily II)
MKRAITLGLLIVIGALSLAVAAAQQPAGTQSMVVEVEKLKDNLFVLRGNGGGGNTAVFVQANGVTVVDTKNPGWGQPILDKIRELTPKPVTRIVNTHTHGDHTSGNVAFPASVEIVTHENTKKRMQEWRPYYGRTEPPRNVFKESGGKGMPTRTFKDKLSIGSGNDEVDLYYFGRGHTDGDAWVVFPSLRTVHAGDIFSGKNLPFLDANNGGSGVAIPDSLQKAHDTLRNVDTIITGHSTQMTWADLKEYIAFNREFLNDVRAAKQAGKSVADVAGAWKMPPKYAGYAAPQPERLRDNVQVIYTELDGGRKTR